MIWLLIALAVCGYLAWWHFVCFRGLRDVPYGQRTSLPVIFKFNAPLARLLSGPSNFALTVPHPFKRAVLIMVARHYITAAHRLHEEGGHAPQIERQGPLDYLPTYLWHVTVLRRRTKLALQDGRVVPPQHQVEREAVERERAFPQNPFNPIGRP